MKLSLVAIFSTLAVSSAFAPSASSSSSSTCLNAESSRKAFIGAATAAVFGGMVLPAFAMDQELVTDKTEQWESGSPTPEAAALRVSRYTNARTQMTSNFAPQKRLTLERKSPVTRLDINAPDFTAYKKTYPGLFRETKP
ncbi:hypothetical protein MPSEU_001098100 [Mayamaea pseudoterrestris]|nr:hypothetical protein MPSEU_001098100 [Mayamaea pseudoterrestris]